MTIPCASAPDILQAHNTAYTIPVTQKVAGIFHTRHQRLRNEPWRGEVGEGRDNPLGAFQFQLFQLFQITFSHANSLLIYYITN